jgi:hypothetical protein
LAAAKENVQPSDSEASEYFSAEECSAEDCSADEWFSAHGTPQLEPQEEASDNLFSEFPTLGAPAQQQQQNPPAIQSTWSNTTTRTSAQPAVQRPHASSSTQQNQEESSQFGPGSEAYRFGSSGGSLAGLAQSPSHAQGSEEFPPLGGLGSSEIDRRGSLGFGGQSAFGGLSALGGQSTLGGQAALGGPYTLGQSSVGQLSLSALGLAGPNAFLSQYSGSALGDHSALGGQSHLGLGSRLGLGFDEALEQPFRDQNVSSGFANFVSN